MPPGGRRAMSHRLQKASSVDLKRERGKALPDRIETRELN
jgi:hypothetical protein